MGQFPHRAMWERRKDQARYRRVTARSEEHTSELQSRLHLVCRLLLEKKKTNTDKRPASQDTERSNHRIDSQWGNSDVHDRAPLKPASEKRPHAAILCLHTPHTRAHRD